MARAWRKEARRGPLRHNRKPAPPDSVESLPEASARLRRFKRDLVADLFTQQGEFGELVRGLRDIAKITPIVRVPPPVDTSVHYPLHELEQAGGENQRLLRYLWLTSMFTFRDRVIPEVYRRSHDLSEAWIKFLSACLLYDPPETELLEFARYADPVSVASDTDDRVSDTDTKQSSDVPVLPIVQLPDPFKARDDAHWYRDAIIDEIGKRFIEPEGLDTSEVFQSVIGIRRDDRGKLSSLGHEYAQRQLDNEPRPYIFVTEETTEEDVKKAFRSIKASRGYPMQGGTPRRDRLTAIQCAILYERHNSTDPTDRRRKRWPYERLAQEFGLKSADAAEGYVDLGRKEIAKKDTP